MKVLGISGGNYHPKYICEIDPDELNAVFNFRKDVNCNNLKVGYEIDLSMGYNYREDLTRLFKSFIESHEKFIKANEVMYNFAKGMIKND